MMSLRGRWEQGIIARVPGGQRGGRRLLSRPYILKGYLRAISNPRSWDNVNHL